MIKQPVFAVVAFLLLLVLAWFVVDRLLFLETAKRTSGRVVNVSAQNSSCGGRRSHYSCTQFNAIVEYTPEGQSRPYHLSLSAGSARGHNQPVSRASLAQGGSVRVAYNPRDPEESYEDSFSGIWGTPILVFVIQISSFFTSLTEPRRRRYYS